MLLQLQLANLLFHAEDGPSHGRRHLTKRQRVIILRQHARLTSHALDVRPEDHEAVVLEDHQVYPGASLPFEQALPDSHSDHAHLNREHNQVC